MCSICEEKDAYINQMRLYDVKANAEDRQLARIAVRPMCYGVS